jgi:hypothetical protein
MSLTTVLELERHPDGTVGVNAIVTGNWSRLEKVIGAVEAIGATGTVDLDFAEEGQKEHATITGAITFTTSNLKAGRRVTVKGTADGSGPYNFTFPGGWVFVGSAAPASLAASKTFLLELFSYGTTDADVVARYTVEP